MTNERSQSSTTELLTISYQPEAPLLSQRHRTATGCLIVIVHACVLCYKTLKIIGCPKALFFDIYYFCSYKQEKQ